MKKQNLSQIMSLAWQFYRQTGVNFSECLKKAWANFKLQKQLKKGIVKFYFQKVDGTIREAWGTLLDVDSKIKGTQRAKNDTLQVYFDTEKQSFRSFKKFNLVLHS